MKEVIYTIGHSTRTAREFRDILEAFGVKLLIDVRTIPRSRTNPQFNKDRLKKFLKRKRIAYRHMPGLGGLRRPSKESVNGAWRNSGFRGFADYMQTKEFGENLKRLIEYARRRKTAVMCAEAVPWRCHRSLIGDALLARKIEILDLFDEKHGRPHHLTSFARIHRGKIFYPPSALESK